MSPPLPKLPIAGHRFAVQGQPAFLIQPPTPQPGRPWVWYAPTLPGLPGDEERWMFRKFLDAGLGIAGIDVGESYGHPGGRALFSALYEELTRTHGWAPRMCLLARSRGGLMHYNWAAEHPAAIAGIAGIYPVCDLRSYPGLDKASPAYGLSEAQLKIDLARHNPIERLAPLARARVPIFHLHGDVDTLVPLEINSGELAQRYRALGGSMTLRIVKGQGHTMWPGWFQCAELVAFVLAHAGT